MVNRLRNAELVPIQLNHFSLSHSISKEFSQYSPVFSIRNTRWLHMHLQMSPRFFQHGMANMIFTGTLIPFLFEQCQKLLFLFRNDQKIHITKASHFRLPIIICCGQPFQNHIGAPGLLHYRYHFPLRLLNRSVQNYLPQGHLLPPVKNFYRDSI